MTHRRYSIGLDIGVSSVGWACMTQDFRIPKYNGRYAIGVREFEVAQTAEARRIQRGTRRRYNRRIRRIQLLQQVLNPLFQDDPGYFIRNDEQEKHFWRNSNQFENNSLSETLKYLGMNTRTYPTIYHLRKSLITQNKKTHPRLIYIALHNLVKFRGHFLNENLSWTSNSNTNSSKKLVKEFFEELLNHFYETEHISEKDFEDIVKLLENKDLTNADKRTEILRILGREFRQPVSLFLGLRANISLMFPNSENINAYKEEKLGLSFSKDDVEETINKLTDEEGNVVEKAYVIYQHILLKDLLGESNYVSEAKVKEYDQFGEDLKTLKKIYNDHLGEQAYRDMFITSRKNWSEYNKTRKQNLLCTFDQFLRIHKTEDNFFRDIKRNLESLIKKKSLKNKEVKPVQTVINKINEGNFLQKQRSHLNAAIPHQNNVYEAETILKNQQLYYPEITDEMIERVKQIISFRIPYYMGPLIKDNQNAKFGWASRKSDDRVKPWTVNEVIDRSQSAENFINRMTSFCSYLKNEKVLPKNSLIYQKFELLNELNGIQIRSSNETPNRKYRLDQKVKNWIIENVFMKYKNVTHRRLKTELKKSPYKDIILDENTDRLKEIHGTQKEDRFGTSLSSFIDMNRIFGDIKTVDQKMLEEIIYWISVFEEKDIIELKIKEKYPHITKSQIRSLTNLSYTGWGRLSKKLVNELPADKQNHLTILDVMKEEPLVFMEVLSIEKYNLEDRILEMNKTANDKFGRIIYQDIEELHGSPALKKGIWQAILVIEELVDIFGEPEHIMIEFAREDGEKRRSITRKRRINDLQTAVQKDEIELKKFLKNHSSYDEPKYRDNRLYLYITQQGKCLYSGESLNISRLQDYEIDHILPRNFVKDDSFDNLALVKQHMNQAKGSDKMPLEVIKSSQRQKQRMFWKRLYDNKLISQTKYYRLMKESFTDQDKESFFARQLVETRQITRHIKDLLEERFGHTEIHPVNANIVTNLRRHSQAIKIRELNNKHHAVDAAMTNLIVQFIIQKYGENFLNFNFKYQEARKKWRQMLTKYRKNFFLFADIVSEECFTHYQTGEIINGHQFLHMLNDEIPWQTTKKIGSSEAAFYDETLYSPRETKGRKPQYYSGKLAKGVHSDLKVASSFLISYKYLNKQKKEVVSSEVVNYLVIEKYQTRGYSDKELALFLAQKVAKGKVIKAKIHTRILKYQRIIINEHPMYFISSEERSEMHNAKQFQPDLTTLEKLYKTWSSILQNEDISIDILKDTFEELANDAIEQYKLYLPDSRIKNIKEYATKVVDNSSFQKGLEELFKMAGASASRSNLFGGRYERKLNPHTVRFVHESITGLRYRKPKSYKHELWSQ